MTREPYKKIFSDKKLLDMMFSLRIKGWSYPSLAMIFGVDYSSIYHECEKFHIKKMGNNNLNMKLILKELGVKAPKLKTYEDYLKEAGYKSQSYYVNFNL